TRAPHESVFQSPTTRGGLRGRREDRHSSLGSARSCAAVVAGARRATWLRISLGFRAARAGGGRRVLSGSSRSTRRGACRDSGACGGVGVSQCLNDSRVSVPTPLLFIL